MPKTTSHSDRRRRDVPPELVELIEELGGAIRESAADTAVFAAEILAAQIVRQFENPTVDRETLEGVADELGVEAPPGGLPEITDEQAQQIVGDILAACVALGTPDAAAIAIAFARYAIDSEVREAAEQIAQRLDAGADAARLAAMGQMKPVKAWRAGDMYGDQANLLIEFAGPRGVAGEGIAALLDWGRGRGYLKDLFAISKADVATALKELRRSASSSRGAVAVAEVEPEDALRQIAAGLERSLEEGEALPLDGESLETHPALSVRLAELGIRADPAPPMTDEQMGAAVAEFLDSPPGRALLDGPDAIGLPEIERWANILLAYGAEDEWGRYLRVGGWKTEEFLFAIVDDVFDIRAADARALGAIVRAWTEWRIGAEGIEGAIADRLRATTTSMTREFEKAHRVDDGLALFDDDRPARPASQRTTPRASKAIVGNPAATDDPMVATLRGLAADPDLRADLERELGPEGAGRLLDLLNADPSRGALALLQTFGGLTQEMAMPNPFGGAAPDPQGPGRTIQVRIDLKGMKPPVWRRLLVPGQARLADLHDAIQIAFDWDGGHLHAFEENLGGWGPFARRSFGPDDEFGDFDQDEHDWEVQALLAAKGDKLEYVYDFGDDWRHVIKVEQVIETPSEVIRCTGGRRSAPIEDSGFDEDGNWAPAPELPFGADDIAAIDSELSGLGPIQA